MGLYFCIALSALRRQWVGPTDSMRIEASLRQAQSSIEMTSVPLGKTVFSMCAGVLTVCGGTFAAQRLEPRCRAVCLCI